jgi:hypothetical protein
VFQKEKKKELANPAHERIKTPNIPHVRACSNERDTSVNLWDSMKDKKIVYRCKN